MKKLIDENPDPITRMAKFGGQTRRQFLADKRRTYNQLIKAIGKFRVGIACFPNYTDIAIAMSTLEKSGDELRKLWRKA